MKMFEYLEQAFDAYNSGKIDADTYDAMLMNAETFVDEEELTKTAENGMRRNLK